MCNIAGYVGTKPAAPILLEMIRRQEGFAGGYYTGIATLHEGKIHYRKLTGDAARLMEMTDATDLPGTVGIIHSRSKSGGGDAWAHPFVDGNRAEPTVAYVANGNAGCFAQRMPAYNRLAQELIGSGFPVCAKEHLTNKNYQTLSDGSTVHMSDVMCQLILRNLTGGVDAVQAMSSAFCEMPSEIVGLLLSVDTPNTITWSRINMPMMLGFAPHGAYLASTAIAIPDDASEPQALPPCSSGTVTAHSLSVTPYRQAPARVAPLDARVRQAAYEKVVTLLKGAPKAFKELKDEIMPLFEQADCVPGALATYEVLYALQKQGLLKTEAKHIAGVTADLTAPIFYMSLSS